jgi:hypothetical protein
MFKKVKKTGEFHKNFRILGLNCTHTRMSGKHAPPFEFYLYVPGMRIGTNSKWKLRLEALKYRLGLNTPTTYSKSVEVGDRSLYGNHFRLISCLSKQESSRYS